MMTIIIITALKVFSSTSPTETERKKRESHLLLAYYNTYEKKKNKRENKRSQRVSRENEKIRKEREKRNT